VSSDGSRLAFLTINLTTACFMEDGKVALLSDAFTSLAMIVDIPALQALTTHVGSGSSAHCLLGQCRSSCMISSGVTRLYDVSVELQLWPDVTGAAPAVAARMQSTFPLKNAANSDGVIDDV